MFQIGQEESLCYICEQAVIPYATGSLSLTIMGSDTMLSFREIRTQINHSKNYLKYQKMKMVIYIEITDYKTGSFLSQNTEIRKI